MPSVVHFIAPAVAASFAAVLVRLLARWRPAVLPFALPVGLLAGAVALTLPFNFRAVWAPRVMADHLLLVAVAGIAAAVRMRRRWVVPLLLAFVTGWWVAHAPPALPEFWRVGLAITILTLALVRSTAPALLAASLAGGATAFLTGAAPVWQQSMLVAAGACAGVLSAPVPALSAASFVAASASLMSLAGGRMITGRFTMVDGAALVPFVAALAWPRLARRFAGALNRARPKPRVAVRRRRA